ncbi:MAG: bile acid:sodium symporter family protein [Pseudomonadota bacterium]
MRRQGGKSGLAPGRVDGFLVALTLAIVAAAVAPELGATGGTLGLDRVVKYGIAVVFFLHGVLLPTESLARGIRNWRLHALVNAMTFGLLPLLGLVAFAASRPWLPEPLPLGLFYATAVASTISSCVALTAVAGGNVAGAVFNATLSGILGVFLTPALTSLVATTAGLELSVIDAIRAIALQVLVPMLAGQLLRPWLAGPLGRRRAAVSVVDRASIVLVVYVAFSDSFRAGVWAQTSWTSLALTATITLALFAVATIAVLRAARAIGLPREDEIAALFCGSQKSLATGIPVASVLFAGDPGLGLVVLPLLLYHQLQLVAGAVLARRYLG